MWWWQPLRGKMREQPLCPTCPAQLIICPPNYTQPHSQLVKLNSPLFSESWGIAAGDWWGEDAATQLDAPGNLSRASTIIPTFPILTAFTNLGFEANFCLPSFAHISCLKPLYVFFLFWPPAAPLACPLDSLPPYICPAHWSQVPARAGQPNIPPWTGHRPTLTRNRGSWGHFLFWPFSSFLWISELGERA